MCYYILTPKIHQSQWKRKVSKMSQKTVAPKGISVWPAVNLLISLELSLNFSSIKEEWEAKPWRPQKDQWLAGVDGMNTEDFYGNETALYDIIMTCIRH